jgi:hypothetical protein
MKAEIVEHLARPILYIGHGSEFKATNMFQSDTQVL